MTTLKAIDGFVWLVRREFWEHRLVLVAPFGVATLELVGYLGGMPFGIYGALADPARQRASLALASNAGCFFIMVTGLVAALFYCLEALHGERRERSILFFKSLPVSDLATVAAKLAVPLIVLPAIVFAAFAVLWPAALVVTTAVLAATGHAVAWLWTSAFPLPLSCLIYALGITALWYLPLYCALLLISVGAKHAPFLWAALPLILIAALDRLVIHSGQVQAFYFYRLFGWLHEALRVNAAGMPVARLPGQFFTSPGLWLGVLAASLFFTAAVQLRRRSTPI
jgi:hypothetical protein